MKEMYVILIVDEHDHCSKRKSFQLDIVLSSKDVFSATFSLESHNLWYNFSALWKSYRAKSLPDILNLDTFATIVQLYIGTIENSIVFHYFCIHACIEVNDY